ncbi:hypothetical protein HZA43_04005 [Candidatus Peregrinibacteria bacterium]|nr:hypothetical protein [Candidatus Peregrinibacteria bacterium]
MKKAPFILIALLLTLTPLLITACQKDSVKITRFDSANKGDVEAPAPVETRGGASEPAVTGDVGIVNERLEITSFKDNQLTTDKAYNAISGKAPKRTYKIKVNNYTLTRFRPGAAHWSYLAAASVNTLKKGENKYAVAAMDQEGNIIDELSFTINYEPALASKALPAVGANLWISLLFAELLSIMYFGIKSLINKHYGKRILGNFYRYM